MITGSNGFIGQYVSDYLEKKGHDVLRIVRDSERSVCEKATVINDFSTVESWDYLFRGVDVVVHLAGLAHISEKHLNMQRARLVNVNQTKDIALAAQRNRVSKFIYLSSAKALGESSGRISLSDATEPIPQSSYGILKIEAETILRTVFNKNVSFMFLRPPLVYGPLVKANFLTLMRILNLGIPLPFGSLKNSRSLIFVGNLADAINCCAISNDKKSGAYTLCDGPALDIPTVCRKLAKSLNKSSRLFPFPLRLLSATPGGAKITSSFVINDSNFRSEFNWSPPFDCDHGFKETAIWFKKL